MANEEHAEILKRSAKEWNIWRAKKIVIRPDLRGIDLQEANLFGANLQNARLDGADLSGAKLSSADLSYANLRDANINNAKLWSAKFSYTNLSGANLQEADLTQAKLDNADLAYAYVASAVLVQANLRSANLSHANLNKVNLKEADLSYANLVEADLSGADLYATHLDETDMHGVIYYYTRFAWLNLCNAKGLDTAIHSGPSSVDLNSVTLPYDKQKCLHFLRGVGYSDALIEYLPSLLMVPLQYHSLFISNSHKDEAFAQCLYHDLQERGVRCWFAPHDLRPGTPILRGVEEAIHWHEKLLLILSRDAVCSSWIEREVDMALHQEIERKKDVLFPIRLDDTILESNASWARRLRHRHVGDFTNWQEEAAHDKAFATLLRHLKVDISPSNSNNSSI